MFINASPDSRSLDMVDLRYVFNLLSVLNERSHSAGVIANVHKMQIKVWMLGKNSRSYAASVWTALVGRSASLVLHHFLFHRIPNSAHVSENVNETLIDTTMTFTVHTYCKYRTKRRISGIESKLHSCWDKITVKNRTGGGGFLGTRGGFRNPWNPPLATPLHRT